MENMLATLRSIWEDEAGQDLVEYTLLLAFVSTVVVAVMINIGSTVNTVWSVTSSDLSKAASQAS